MKAGACGETVAKQGGRRRQDDNSIQTGVAPEEQVLPVLNQRAEDCMMQTEAAHVLDDAAQLQQTLQNRENAKTSKKQHFCT